MIFFLLLNKEINMKQMKATVTINCGICQKFLVTKLLHNALFHRLIPGIKSELTDMGAMIMTSDKIVIKNILFITCYVFA